MSPTADTKAGDAGGTAAREPRPHWGALAALSLSTTCFALSASIVIVALPTMAESFAASFAQIQWLIIAYLLATTVLIVSVGRLSDIVGRRKLLVAGLLVFLGASVLGGTASSLWVVICARGLQGLGGAMMVALSMALVSETVSRDGIGRAMGLLATMSAVGTASGAPLGGLLTTAFGWRSVFLVNVPLGLLALLLAFLFVPADRTVPGAARQRFDILGTLLLAATLSAYALAMTTGGNAGSGSAWLLAAAVAGTGLFIFSQARTASPLVRLSAFRKPDFSAGLFDNMVVMMVATMTTLVGPFYLSGAIGLNDALVGVVMAIGPITAVLGSVVVGRLVDRLGTPRMIVSGLILAGVGLGGVAALATMLGLAGFIIGTTVFSLGYIMFVVANNTAIMSGAEQDHRGVVSGMLNLARNFGSIIAASALGTLFASVSGAADVALASPEGLVRGTQITFAVAAGFVAVSIAVSLSLRGRFRSPAGPAGE